MTSGAIPDALARPVGAGGFRSALAHAELPWYLLHHAVAGTAQSLGAIAVAVSIYDQTHSIAWVAAAAVARLLPYLLLSGPAGVLADRCDLRRLLVWSSGLRVASVSGLAFAVGAGAPALVVVTLVLVATALGTPCFPAMAALVPSVVPAVDLPPANGLLSTIETMSWMIGPAAGGLLLLGGSPAFALTVDAGLFVLGLLALVPTTHGPSARVRGAGPQRERFCPVVATGVRAALTSAGIAVPLLLVIVVNVIFGGASLGLLLVARTLLHGGRGGFGLLVAALGLGGLLGIAMISQIANSRRPDIGVIATSIVAGVSFAALALVRSSWLAALLMVLVGAGSVTSEVVAMTLLLRSLPRHLIVRVFGLTDALLVGSALLGAFLAPVLIDLTSLRTSLVIVGAGVSAVAILGARQWRELAVRQTINRSELRLRLELLARQPWLAYVLPTVLESLAAGAVEEDVLAGTVVVRQGERPDDLYLIVEGQFEVTRCRPGEPLVTVDRLGPGQGFGEVGLLGHAPRTASVTAVQSGSGRAPCDGGGGGRRSECGPRSGRAKVLRISADNFVAAVNSAPMAAEGSVAAGLIARMAAGATASGAMARGCGREDHGPEGHGPEDRHRREAEVSRDT